MNILVFYVPVTDKDKVKHSCFEAGAGMLGRYDQCCFETLGIGQFRPLEGSKPHLGLTDKLEFVEEVRVEMVVEKNRLIEVIKALKSSHPYEEVAYHVYETLNLEDLK